MDLSSKQCVPCRGGVPPLAGDSLVELHGQLDEGWKVVDEHHLAKGFEFRDFAAALAYVNRVGAMAEQQGHHPDVHLAWGKVRIEIWTHKIDGLTESDFVFAARCDTLLEPA
jgi:4a-hydroxytetrahydrobiopterin dehydratase